MKKSIKRNKEKYLDGLLSFAASFIKKGTSLIVTIMLARVFGAKLFGEYAFLKQAFDVLIVFLLFGGDKSLIYFSAINKSDGLKKLLSVIKFVSVIVIVLFFSSLFFSDKLLVNYDFYSNSIFLLIFASTILLSVVVIFVESYFIGIKSLKTYFKSVIISAILFLPLSYFCASKYGLIGAFFALFLQLFSQLLFVYFKRGQYLNLNKISIKKKDLKELYVFSFPIGIGELSFDLVGFLTSVILLNHTNFVELGVYNVAIRMVMFIVFIPNLLNNILLSYLSNEINKEKFLLKTFFLNLLLSGIVGFVFYVFSKQIFTLFGEGFKENLNDVFLNLIYGVIPLCSSYILLQYLISIKKRWSYLFFRLLRQGLSIGLFVLAIKFKFTVNAILLSKCFVYANYISFILLILFISIHYFNERKEKHTNI
jgi:O-antigen/teichoic acid export membrane protein